MLSVSVEWYKFKKKAQLSKAVLFSDNCVYRIGDKKVLVQIQLVIKKLSSCTVQSYIILSQFPKIKDLEIVPDPDVKQ